MPSLVVGHLRTDFCAAADLYCRREHLDHRIDATTHAGEVLDLAAAAEAGRTAWADVAGLVPGGDDSG